VATLQSWTLLSFFLRFFHSSTLLSFPLFFLWWLLFLRRSLRAGTFAPVCPPPHGHSSGFLPAAWRRPTTDKGRRAGKLASWRAAKPANRQRGELMARQRDRKMERRRNGKRDGETTMSGVGPRRMGSASLVAWAHVQQVCVFVWPVEWRVVGRKWRFVCRSLGLPLSD